MGRLPGAQNRSRSARCQGERRDRRERRRPSAERARSLRGTHVCRSARLAGVAAGLPARPVAAPRGRCCADPPPARPSSGDSAGGTRRTRCLPQSGGPRVRDGLGHSRSTGRTACAGSASEPEADAGAARRESAAARDDLRTHHRDPICHRRSSGRLRVMSIRNRLAAAVVTALALTMGSGAAAAETPRPGEPRASAADTSATVPAGQDRQAGRGKGARKRSVDPAAGHRRKSTAPRRTTTTKRAPAKPSPRHAKRTPAKPSPRHTTRGPTTPRPRHPARQAPAAPAPHRATSSPKRATSPGHQVSPGRAPTSVSPRDAAPARHEPAGARSAGDQARPLSAPPAPPASAASAASANHPAAVARSATSIPAAATTPRDGREAVEPAAGGAASASSSATSPGTGYRGPGLGSIAEIGADSVPSAAAQGAQAAAPVAGAPSAVGSTPGLSVRSLLTALALGLLAAIAGSWLLLLLLFAAGRRRRRGAAPRRRPSHAP